jgi:hypothetical protein
VLYNLILVFFRVFFCGLNTLFKIPGKVCNCLIQFLLTVVLSIEELVFISGQRLSERTVLEAPADDA